MEMKHDLALVAPHFRIPGEFVEAAPYGSGHINDTYAAVYSIGGAPVRYLHQRINDKVFPHPAELMDNIHRVTTHLRARLTLAGEKELSRAALTVIPARDGKPYYRSPEGEFWRTYIFIEKAMTYDVVPSAAQAYQGARAFGRFCRLLSDLPAPRLYETIPDFHHTPKRFAALQEAIAADAAGRVKDAQPEIDFALAQESWISTAVEARGAGVLPERVTHNDTKFNNVMIDDATGAGVCVIDLDTVMPGLSLYDFGDMVRTTTSPAAEDEEDVSKVTMRAEFFVALLRGYTETFGEDLARAERELLPLAGKLITCETGIRFLTDYLAGDTYFKVKRPDHNLVRCRTQFALVRSIEEQENDLHGLVKAG